MLTKKQLEIEVPRIYEYIRNYFKDNGFTKAVVGNSGGKDSAVVIGLLANAIGKENVLTVTLPCYSKEEDREDALLVAKTFGTKCINVKLDKVVDEMISSVEMGYGSKLSKEAIINIKPRLRMTALYAVAVAENAIVVGTGNLCEIFVGYFTKFGDGASDFNLLGEFFVSDVYKIGEYIGIPAKICKKAPSDGISGRTDEEKLKFKYAQVEEYITTGNTDSDAKAKIERLHKITEHKRNPVPVYSRIKDWSKYDLS